MSETPNNLSNSSDEIELIKIIKYLLIHWKIIILSIFVFVVIGINNNITKKSTFRTSVILETGQYFLEPNVSANLLTDNELVRYLKVSLMKKSDQNIPEVEFILLDKKLIEVQITSNSIKTNLNLIDSLMLNITDREEEILNKINLNNRDKIKESIGLKSKLLDIYNQELFQLLRWRELADSIKLKSMIEIYESNAIREIVILENEIMGLENSPNYQLSKTKIVRKPENITSKSSFLFAVFSSIIIGLIAALTFLALKHFINIYKSS